MKAREEANISFSRLWNTYAWRGYSSRFRPIHFDTPNFQTIMICK